MPVAESLVTTKEPLPKSARNAKPTPLSRLAFSTAPSDQQRKSVSKATLQHFAIRLGIYYIESVPLRSLYAFLTYPGSQNERFGSPTA